MRALLCALVLAGCGPDPDAPAFDADPGGNPDASTTPRPDAGPDPFFGRVYAHSASDLYEIDPRTLAITHVGPFTFDANTPGGTDVITDIALDKNAYMVGISYDKVFEIDKDTAACRFRAPLTAQLNGLSFVPIDDVDPTEAERLVGTGLGGELFEIDPVTGASTPIGNFGGGWQSSGDLVSVYGFGTVATVTDGIQGTDKLARVDVNGGGAATIIGDTGFGDVWGIAFWGGQVYGFTNNYEFILIDVTTGAATLAQNTAPYWWGAGVTTQAPVIP